MTERDAVALIVAAVSAHELKESAAAFREWSGLVQPHDQRAWSGETCPPLGLLPRGHCFTDALATLLSTDSLDFLAGDAATQIRVQLGRPRLLATIRISPKGGEEFREYVVDPLPWSRAKTGRGLTAMPPDLQELYVFTEQTIYAVALCLSGRESLC
tara:strand:- start:241 stop:711 length:471 start_codon:yes stop_codon:yes gene_type:complete